MRCAFLIVLIMASGVTGACQRRRVPRSGPDGGHEPSATVRDGGPVRDASDDGGRPLCRGRVEPFDPIDISFEPIAAVDVLFVVDDSSTMAQEQFQLAKQFEMLLGVLAGRPDPRTPRSLHLGVVSGDLGLHGVEGVAGCAGFGDDGVLLHAGTEEGACARSLPTFLSFAPAADDLTQTANELACMTTLGTDGCGLQQPLEAALKALTPAERGDVFFGAGHERGHADGANLGFARTDGAGQERAVQAVVVISDKDDCSLMLPERWAKDASFTASDQGQLAQQLNIRCTQLRDERFVLDRYGAAFGAAIEPDRQFVFAAITGIPRFTGVTDRLLTTTDHEERDAIFTQLLDDARMQYRVDDHASDTVDDDTLVPVCEGNHGQAWPARRLVELAQRSGANAIVGSICENDYSEVINAVRQRIAERLVGPCLQAPLLRDRDGLVACDLIWHLPPGAPRENSCDDPRFPFLMPDRDPLGSTPADPSRCRVLQLPVTNRNGQFEVQPADRDGEPVHEGWFYDDFSSDTNRQCPGFPRRIALRSQQPPSPDVRIQLQCLQRATDPDPAPCQPLR